MRLGDLDYMLEKWENDPSQCGYDPDFYAVKALIKNIPTIDPETLPIVKQLRAEVKRLNKGIESLSKNVEIAYKQRDGAVEQLRGICRSCKNYTENHCCGPCGDCKYEYYAYRFADAKDRWEWIGLKDENNS